MWAHVVFRGMCGEFGLQHGVWHEHDAAGHDRVPGLWSVVELDAVAECKGHRSSLIASNIFSQLVKYPNMETVL